MSSSTIIEPGFGNTRQRPRWFTDIDGAYATTVDDQLEQVQAIWDLTDYLASGETVSSVAYADSGAVSSGKSLATPQITFTLTGLGETKLTATLSTGRVVIRRFRITRSDGWRRSDYGQ